EHLDDGGRVRAALLTVTGDEDRDDVPGAAERLRRLLIIDLPDGVREVERRVADDLVAGPLRADEPLPHRLQHLEDEGVPDGEEQSITVHGSALPGPRELCRIRRSLRNAARGPLL